MRKCVRFGFFAADTAPQLAELVGFLLVAQLFKKQITDKCECEEPHTAKEVKTRYDFESFPVFFFEKQTRS